MLAEPWGYARENIAPLVLVEVWAARQRRPTLVLMSSCTPFLPFFQRSFSTWIFAGSFTPSWSRAALA
jgi:hypothetical protein